MAPCGSSVELDFIRAEAVCSISVPSALMARIVPVNTPRLLTDNNVSQLCTHPALVRPSTRSLILSACFGEETFTVRLDNALILEDRTRWTRWAYQNLDYSSTGTGGYFNNLFWSQGTDVEWMVGRFGWDGLSGGWPADYTQEWQKSYYCALKYHNKAQFKI